MTDSKHYTPEEAQELILSGNAPEGMVVDGNLDLDIVSTIILPPRLQVEGFLTISCETGKYLRLSKSYLKAHSLSIINCFEITKLTLPIYFEVEALSIVDCMKLTSLPNNLKVHQLMLSNCTKLISLPSSLEIDLLDISYCTNLTILPNNLYLRVLSLWSHVGISTLPDDLHAEILNLNSANEPIIQNTTIERLEQFEIYWNDVEVPAHILKYPERLTPQEILDEPNSEVRRVMLERYGEQKFIENLGAEPVHGDTYGVLYRVELPNDEPLVMVRVQDASTDREYFLRVPPDMQTAHQAVAWTFGMTPDEYHPDVET